MTVSVADVVTIKGDMRIMLSSELGVRVRRGEHLVIVPSIPRDIFVDAHERQCDRNHSQTLEGVRGRGGLDAVECLAILAGVSFREMGAIPETSAHRLLYNTVATFNRGQRVAEANATSRIKSVLVTGGEDQTTHKLDAVEAAAMSVGLRASVKVVATPSPVSPQAEPVAWQHRGPRGGWITTDEKTKWSERPLYAHPPATPAIEPDGWKPIETAKPNVAVQVFIPHADYYGNNGVYAGMLVDMGSGQRWITFGWAVGRDLGADTQPTHWRALPVPPSPSEGQR